MSLNVAWLELESELNDLSRHLRDFAAQKHGITASTHFSTVDECLLEGLLSRVWQAWGGFCRSCIIHSCLGTNNAAGVVIPGLPDAITLEHVSGAAIRAKNAKSPYWPFPNGLLRYEPTWGDLGVLSKLITRLLPTNHAQMLAAFSSGSSHVKAVQLIRNCAAHNHVQNFQEVRELHPSYIVFPITHPTHALFWVVPSSSDFLITHSIDGMKEMALTAVS